MDKSPLDFSLNKQVQALQKKETTYSSTLPEQEAAGLESEVVPNIRKGAAK